MTPQSTFMITADIRAGEIENLRKLLSGMNKVNAEGHADPDNNLVPFGRYERLHYARFMIVEAKTEDDLKKFGIRLRHWKPALTFFGDFDGDRNSFLAELAEHSSSGLDKIFSLCEGYTEKKGTLLKWMKKQNIQPAANYINWIGRTVKQVHEEAALHQSLSVYLQDIVEDVGRGNTRILRQKLLSHVEMEKHAGRLFFTPPEPTPTGWKIRNFLHLVGVPLVLLWFTPLFLLIAPFYAIRLRMLERSDPEIIIRPSLEHIKNISSREDRDVSNHFCVFGDVKPGLFRLFTLKFILMLTNYIARHVYNRGFLNRIKTIHFARWVFMGRNRKVFFPTNYDGSHESYMDDFINKVGWGLNVIFSNFVPYPTTRWMIKGGAHREQQFKYTQRMHQLRSEVWYKAYPDLTATDLGRNSRIRQGVEVRQSSDAEIREWLGMI